MKIPSFSTLVRSLTAASLSLACLGAAPTAAHAANFVVNSTDDTDGDSCGTTCTLRQAINNANSADGADTISFDPGVFGSSKQTITLTNLPAITDDLAINGPSTTGAGVTLNNTESDAGGTLIVQNGTVSISNLTFVSARAGVYQNGEGTTVTVAGCNFTGFFGVLCSQGLVTINNSTFMGARYGVYDVNGNGSTIDSCTIVDNRRGVNSTFFPISVSNSVLVGDQSEGDFTDGGHNIIGGTAADAGLQVDDDSNAVLADNGGPTQTVALVAGGAAVDAGATTLTTDQRGFIRPVGSAADIGAYELDPAQSGPDFVVNSTDDHDDGGCGVADCTLREAIKAANANSDASNITFDATVFASKKSITLDQNLGQLPQITAQVAITGPSAEGAGVAIDANGGSGIAYLASSTVKLSFLTFKSSSNLDIYQDHGALTVNDCTFTGNGRGCLFNGGGTLTISNSTFSDNISTDVPASGSLVYNNNGTLLVGGSTFANNTISNAIYNDGTFLLTDSTFSGNSGDSSVIYGKKAFSASNCVFTNNTSTGAGAAIFGEAPLTIESCTFTGNSSSDNSSSDNSGGAIFVDGTLNINNSTFSNNSSSGNGGAIFNDKTLTLNNCTFTGNSTPDSGGAIFSVGTLTSDSSTFAGNSSGINGGAIYIYAIAVGR